MKTASFVLALSMIFLGLSPTSAKAGQFDGCGSSGYGLDPMFAGVNSAPPIPADATISGSIPNLVVTPLTTNEIDLKWDGWTSAVNIDPNYINYLVFYSSDNGATWKCGMSLGDNTATIDPLTPNTDYRFAVVATGITPNTYSAIAYGTGSTKRHVVQVCPPSNYSLKPVGNFSGYTATSGFFELVIGADASKPIPSQAESPELAFLDYVVQYSIDNWKTMAVVKSLSGGKGVPGDYIKFAALSPTKVHQIKAIPVLEDISVQPTDLISGYTAQGCKVLQISISPKTVVNGCKIDPIYADCPDVLVPGPNSTSPSKSPKTLPKVTQLVCVKGKSVLTVSGTTPICPTGYKRKT